MLIVFTTSAASKRTHLSVTTGAVQFYYRYRSAKRKIVFLVTRSKSMNIVTFLVTIMVSQTLSNQTLSNQTKPNQTLPNLAWPDWMEEVRKDVRRLSDQLEKKKDEGTLADMLVDHHRPYQGEVERCSQGPLLIIGVFLAGFLSGGVT